MRRKRTGDDGSATQKRPPAPLPYAVRAKKNSSTPIASETIADNGGANKNTQNTNKNLAQDKETDAVRTWASYFDPVWNAFSKHIVRWVNAMDSPTDCGNW